MKIFKVETEKDWDRFLAEPTEEYDLVIVTRKFIDRIWPLSKKKKKNVELRLG